MILAALALALAAACLLAGIEAALLAVSRVRARHAADEGDRRAGVLVRLLEQRGDLLQCAVAANHAMAVTAFALLAAALRPWLGEWDLTAAVILALPVFLVGLELLPKALFRRYPFRILRRLTLLLRVLGMAAAPWRGARRMLLRSAAARQGQTTGGVAALADNIASLRILPETSVALLHGFATFGASSAGDLMTPLSSISALPADLPLGAALPVVEENAFRHHPVLDERGAVIGYFDAARLSRHVSADRLIRLFTQPLIRVRAADPALRWLQVLRKSGAPVALVLDGGEKAAGVLYLDALLDALLVTEQENS